MKVDKNVLGLFTISESTATKDGANLPEVVDVSVKYKWDDASKQYTNEVRNIVIDTFFDALKKSRIEVLLPSTALSVRDIEDWQKRLEDEDIITISFDNLKIGLRSGYKGEVMVVATADGVAEVTG